MSEFGEFWKTKILAHVKRLDTNQDGVLTRKDFEDMADNYARLNRQSELKCRQMRAAFLKYWDEILSDLARVQPVSAEVYIEALMKLDKQEIKRKVFAIESLLFDIMDVNNEGFIRPAEFEFWFKVVGLDAELAKETFRAIDINHDNKLSREEYMAAVEEFFIGEDEQSPFRFLWGPLN